MVNSRPVKIISGALGVLATEALILLLGAVGSLTCLSGDGGSPPWACTNADAADALSAFTLVALLLPVAGGLAAARKQTARPLVTGCACGIAIAFVWMQIVTHA